MKRINQANHDQLVAYAMQYLINKGFKNIKADLRGYAQPGKITWTSSGKGHIPDVTARNGHLYIFEVETADSIRDAHTADQWGLFSKFVAQHGGEFWVVVPTGSQNEASNRLFELSITNAKVWTV